MNPDFIAVGVSLVALGISALALGWNIYRDVILRARVRVRVAVVSLITPGSSVAPEGRFIRLAVTNHGPGPVEVTSIGGKAAPFWRLVFRRVDHFVLMPDHSNPLSTRLPSRLDVGQTANFYFPHRENSVLGTDATHVGVYDSFGRSHYSRGVELETAKKIFRSDFPEAKARRVGAAGSD